MPRRTAANPATTRKATHRTHSQTCSLSELPQQHPRPPLAVTDTQSSPSSHQTRADDRAGTKGRRPACRRNPLAWYFRLPAAASREGYGTCKMPPGQQAQLQRLGPARFPTPSAPPGAALPSAANSAQRSTSELAAPPFPTNVHEENRFGPLSPAPAMEVFVLLINSHYKQL